MPIITESAITLNFPDNNYFRFENCEGYKLIKNNFKEMDVCWYEQVTDTLYLIELKDWKDGSLIEEQDPNISHQQIIQTKKNIATSNIHILVKKSIDSVCMFMSILLEKPHAAKIQACVPFTITHNTKIKLLSIINWTNPDISPISAINTEYKSKFKPYKTLFNIQACLVLTKIQASNLFTWIS